MVTAEQFVGIHAQMNEIVKRVGNGSFDADAVKRSLQELIERKDLPVEYGILPPRWWRRPELQMERAQKLWPDVQLPEPPKCFAPQTATEILLLHVPDRFDLLRDRVEPPRGRTFFITDELSSADEKVIRRKPNLPPRHEPVWLAFDYAANHGVNPKSLVKRSDLAAGEVLSAAIQFPDWANGWDGWYTPYPCLAYQYQREGSWMNMPVLFIRKGRVTLKVANRDAVYNMFCSPVVREVCC